MNVTNIDKLTCCFSFLASGLQLYIASDGTASLGNPEVKSRKGGTVFKV